MSVLLTDPFEEEVIFYFLSFRRIFNSPSCKSCSFLINVIPKYVNTVIFGAMVESTVCELGARMTAMDSATENAEEMVDSLNLIYNRARQSAITQEITEIVSGSGIYS